MAISVRKRGSKINLLPQEGFASTTSGRILLWILSSFRVIVIVTELIVMSAFLSRFVLDAKNTDLNEEIQEKSSIINAQAGFEQDFKEAQQKINIFSSLTTREGVVSETLEAVVEGLPPDVFLDQLTLGDDGAVIVGTSPSERSIQQFIVNLDAKDTLGAVEVNKIESDNTNESFLKFTIQANY